MPRSRQACVSPAKVVDYPRKEASITATMRQAVGIKKSWDPIWEQIFASQSWGKYPPEELIRFVASSYYHAANRRDIKILEVGCGAGACAWYMAREGFCATGIDGSPSAIRQAKELLGRDQLAAEFICGDVANLSELVKGRKFDAIVDAACLQCNRSAQVTDIVDQIFDVLLPGGRFFTILVAADSHGYGLGEEVEKGTFDKITEGPLKNRGLNHFFTLEEVKGLFCKFDSIEIDFTLRSFQNRAGVYKNWVCTGVKPT